MTDAPVLDPYFTFTGREYDKETGLYYYRARYYDSSTGRFISADPVAGKAKLPITVTNKYIYGNNNPIIMIDPMGTFSLKGLFGDIADFVTGGDSDIFNKIKVLALGHFIAGPAGQLAMVNWSGQFSETEINLVNTVVIVAASMYVGGAVASEAGFWYGSGVQGGLAGSVFGGLAGGLTGGAIGWALYDSNEGFWKGAKLGFTSGAMSGFFHGRNAFALHSAGAMSNPANLVNMRIGYGAIMAAHLIDLD